MWKFLILWSLEVWLRGVDLNHRPLGYEPNELPDCSTPRCDDNNHFTNASNRYLTWLCALPIRSMTHLYRTCAAAFRKNYDLCTTTPFVPKTHSTAAGDIARVQQHSDKSRNIQSCTLRCIQASRMQ